jgi:hypothetical protein
MGRVARRWAAQRLIETGFGVVEKISLTSFGSTYMLTEQTSGSIDRPVRYRPDESGRLAVSGNSIRQGTVSGWRPSVPVAEPERCCPPTGAQLRGMHVSGRLSTVR